MKVIEGKGLGAFDSNGKSDPYVKIKCNGKNLGRSQIIKNTLNPVWNYVLDGKTFAIGDEIEILIYDYDFLVSDDYMGSCFIKVTQELVNTKQTNLKLQVMDQFKKVQNKYPGELIVELYKS